MPGILTLMMMSQMGQMLQLLSMQIRRLQPKDLVQIIRQEEANLVGISQKDSTLTLETEVQALDLMILLMRRTILTVMN